MSCKFPHTLISMDDIIEPNITIEEKVKVCAFNFQLSEIVIINDLILASKWRPNCRFHI